MDLNMDKDILFSIINMKLRDFYSDLDDLIVSEDIDKDILLEKFDEYGFTYNKDINQLKSLN
ncbi:DUF4250 domain-containing protein [Helcococcus sueciensis]|uniref:DUF4250 domain-containing protein n=1 Tax=Helcococcus sueciensis TaxID=241555 RepID=UPI0003FD3F47|nr:DUF4250 domain-containing protein [Helcococcus sueciensis]